MPYELVECSPSGIVVVDAGLRITAMNRRGRDGLFANAGPVVGRSLDDVLRVLWPAGVASDLVGHVRRTLETGEAHVVRDFAHARRDADRIDHVEWELHRLELPDGAGPGVVCYWSDLTPLHDAQKALRESVARQHRLVEGVVDYAIIELSLEGTIVYWNRGAERLLGWTEAEVLGRPGSIFFMAQDREMNMPEREMETAVRAGRSEDERWHVRKDGTRFWGSGLMIPLKDDGERHVVGFVKIFRDRTKDWEARRALEEVAGQRAELLDSERAARLSAERIGRMKDEFLATLSHELRTPLHAILGWSDILERSRTEESVASAVKVIRRNARAQLQLIEELLDVSRIVSGTLKLDFDAVVLRDVLCAALDAVSPAAAAKDIRVEQSLGDGSEIVPGDAARLQQVFGNLLNNGVKFTPPGGVVRLAVERDAGGVRVTVTDTGQGIGADFLPHVFDRFRQEDASSTRRQGGLGLGLTIVRQIVHLHGGSVAVHSEGADRGAVFTVRLPLAPSAAADAFRLPEPASTRELAGRLAGRCVLLVDDDPDALALNERMLRDVGANLLLARSAAQALELVSTERPEILISDIGMPDLDGYELIRRVRSLPESQGGATRAIALTAYARPEDEQQALRAGYDAFLTKPVEVRKLIDAIRAVLGTG